MPKSSVEQYQEFQDYTNYIDTSDVMLGFYKNQSGTGLEKYYLMIEEWLSMQCANAEDNKPLVIQADGGVGKKTLLVKWFEYHQAQKSQKKNDLIILHFATTGGNNSNYFYAIYRILIKLREELNIGQKVELHEEKLRKYFAYWLDVCNQRIENQIIQNVATVYDKIILVFEGIDYFLDRGTAKEGNIAFWLPRYFPKHVKVIVTADRESESMRYFNKLQCPKVNIPYDINIMKSMIKWQNQKSVCVNEAIKTELIELLESNIRSVEVTSLYVKSYLSCLLPEKVDNIDLSEESLLRLQHGLEKIDKAKLKELRNVDDLFDFILDFWSGTLFQNETKFKELIGLLISTQKGLTLSEIASVSKIESEELKLFITIFRSFLMNFKDLWMIKNDSFKRSINKKYSFVPTTINERIAQTLKRTPNSVRKLEEETFQLYNAENYFKLKEVISDIENFLLLFNPYTKYDLCRYWQRLEERSFDPVIEYNKAIQGFEMHYHPSSDDLFRIITQISRFLREFSDFETYYTPEFRHPKIVGNEKELNDIGILGELRNLALCEEEEEPVKCDQNSEELVPESSNSDEIVKPKKKQKESPVQSGNQPCPSGQSSPQGNEVNPKQTKKCVTVKENAKTPKKQSRVQQLNVQVKSNENYFREHYYQEIKPFLEKVSLEGEKEPGYSIDYDDEEDEEDEDTLSQEEAYSLGGCSQTQQKTGKHGDKEKSRGQDFKDLKMMYARSVQEQFELKQRPPTNYYYKRWIWMQFPWVCMTMKCNYSEKLRKCFTSPTSYMSVSEEREFTLQALKIALEAKKKKQAILQKVEAVSEPCAVVAVPYAKKNASKNNEKHPNRENSILLMQDPSMLSSQTQQTTLSKPKRIEELAFITNSFLSLHNLSREIEVLRLRDKSQMNDSKGSLFITADEKGNESASLFPSFNRRKNRNATLQVESELKQPTKSSHGLLPRIKQRVNNEMLGELNELEKNNVAIRREMDSYLYKNRQLAKKLKELKIIQHSGLSQAKNEQKMHEKRQKIAQVQQKIQKVKQQYGQWQQEHEHLNVLISICRHNKTHNEEAIPDLVLECNNFKKMIRLESEAIQDLKKKTEEIKKLKKKFVENFKEKIENQADLHKEIQVTIKNRDHFNHEIQRYDDFIAQELLEKRKELSRLNLLHSRCSNLPSHKGDQLGQYHKQYDKDRKYHCEENNYEEVYTAIKKSLGVDNIEDFKMHDNYLRLLEGLAKKREFEAVYVEREMELEDLRRRHTEMKRELEILTRAKEDSISDAQSAVRKDFCDGERDCRDDVCELEKELLQKKRILAKTTAMKLSCLGMLNTLYSRMGLAEQTKLVITEQFVEKVEEARVMSQVETC